jgi:hypothetical protein
MGQPLVEDPAQADAFHLVVQPGIEGVDVDRQPALAPEVVPGVLVAGLNMLGGDAQPIRQGQHEGLGVLRGVLVRVALVREQGRVVPARLAVGPPVDAERPAGQLLAGIPLALAEVQEAALPVVGAQALRQVLGDHALGRAQRVGVPLGPVAVVHRHERGFAPHRQAHVARHQQFVHRLAQREHLAPLLLGVGLGDAR